ncbi:MAG: hypothetical protein ACLQU4_21700 [Limisphaerales bacterium]
MGTPSRNPNHPHNTWVMVEVPAIFGQQNSGEANNGDGNDD